MLLSCVYSRLWKFIECILGEITIKLVDGIGQ